MVEEIKSFKIDTAYNHINLHQQGGRLELRSDDNALQSLIDLNKPHELGLRNLEHLMSVLLFIPQPQRILMLGTAAGSLLHYLRHHYPLAQITALDIDAELIEKMLEMKILPPAGNGLTYVYDDAACFINACDQSFDLILVDIFSGAQSPAWLIEKSAITALYHRLGEHGAVAYNLLIDSEHDFKLFYRDLRLVFHRQTLCMPVKDYENTIALAIRHPLVAREMAWYMQHAAEMSERFEIDFLQILSVIYNTNPVGAGVL
jgi:spermidine synthase